MTDNQPTIIVNTSKFNSAVILLSAVLIIVLIVTGYFAFKSLKDESTRLSNEIVEFKKLTDTLVRSSTRWVTKDDLEKNLQNMLTQKDLQALKEDMKKLNSQLSAVGKTVGEIANKTSSNEKSDKEGDENKDVVSSNDGRLIDVF
jgi:hypothetical protein